MDEKRAAALMLADCLQAMSRSGENAVTALLGEAPFEEWHHYPSGDVSDRLTGCRFYYHAHGESERVAGEHGHFHTFAPGDDGRLTHLAAISVDAYGRPFRLFSVNRWVTDDAWRSDRETAGLVRNFVVDAIRPSWVVSRWLTALVAFYRPEIEQLICGREGAFRRLGYSGDRFSPEALEDRRIQNLTERTVDLGADLTAADVH